jgi:hypothetical protein
MFLIQKSLYLHSVPSDAVCLVPVSFCVPKTATLDADRCNTLHLAPSAGAKLFSQTHNLTNAATDGYRLNSFNGTDEYELH